MIKTKIWYRSATMWVAIVTVVGGTANLIAPFLKEPYSTATTILIAVCVGLLRFFRTDSKLTT